MEAPLLLNQDPIGDILVARRLITLEQLDEAAERAVHWGVPLGDAILSSGFVRPQDYYRVIAEQFQLPFVDLLKQPPDASVLVAGDVEEYNRSQVMPYRREGNILHIVTTNPGPETLLYARQRYGTQIAFAVTSKFDIAWSLQTIFETHYTDQSLHALSISDPTNSARIVYTRSQLWTAAAMAGALVIGLSVWTIPTLIGIAIVMSIFFLGNFLFKGLLAWSGSSREGPHEKVSASEVAELHDEDLPIYTVLVPMFREPEVLPILANALRQMDYPFAKLDIKLVLEAGDHATIDAAKALGLESVFEIVRVPPSQPQTKPKACNYALHFARGDYLVIFDAEDKPEPDQLKKTIVAFKKAGPRTLCIQARLNYYNATENWLTRLFTLDYSLWFDLMLPGLERLGIPIPLGGTSNHFRLDVLRELRAWDPYNVTEDADLGIRIAQKGYVVGTVNSTTFEEANCQYGNWIRQRSRWLKGYMQTYLVHMRHPIELYRSIGGTAFWGFQFFVGGTVMAALMNPLFWAIYATWLLTRAHVFDLVFPTPLLYINLVTLLAGNATMIYLNMMAPVRRGWYHLIPYALSVIGYWALMSVAAYKGLWQLIRNPFYWEKTQHGLSKVTAAEVARALRAETVPV